MSTVYDVVAFAVVSRIIFMSAVALFEYMLPHYPSDQFWAPVWLAHQDSVGPGAKMFFGLGNWDSQHFVHIAHSGYTFQTDIPFFPLFPILVRIVATGLEFVGLDVLSSIILAAVSLNLIFFIWSAITLFELTKNVFCDETFALLASVLYCVSPATIFFMAFYSEALYALCTFQGLLSHHRYKPVKAAVWFAAACLTRSNGLVNAGFILHYYLTLATIQCFYDIQAGPFLKRLIRSTRYIAIGLGLTFIMMFPFAAFQVYTHNLLCSNSPANISPELRNHSDTYKIPLLSDHADYCDISDKFILPYVWVQDKFWDVGVFKYWTTKQIPNFLLAFPVVFLITIPCVRFIYRNKIMFITPHVAYIGGWHDGDDFPPLAFVYAVHALFLVVSSFFVINVQVITRLIASSTPMLYWIAARYMVYNGNVPIPSELIFDFLGFHWYGVSFKGMMVHRYFVGYTLAGLLLFSNGFPWT